MTSKKTGFPGKAAPMSRRDFVGGTLVGSGALQEGERAAQQLL